MQRLQETVGVASVKLNCVPVLGYSKAADNHAERLQETVAEETVRDPTISTPPPLGQPLGDTPLGNES